MGFTVVMLGVFGFTCIASISPAAAAIASSVISGRGTSGDKYEGFRVLILEVWGLNVKVVWFCVID